MCHTPPVGTGQATTCDNAGNLPSCALCPNSPTYWRNTAAPDVADPWNGTQNPPQPDVDMTGWVQDREPRDATRPGYVDHLRCVICRVPTTWISPKGKRCHPSCARTYLRIRAQQRPPAAPRSAQPA